MFAVVVDAYLHGLSTREVDDLVRALGVDTGISKSEVSRICAGLLTPTENRAINARRVLGLVATLHQNSECENNGTTWT